MHINTLTKLDTHKQRDTQMHTKPETRKHIQAQN